MNNGENRPDTRAEAIAEEERVLKRLQVIRAERTVAKSQTARARKTLMKARALCAVLAAAITLLVGFGANALVFREQVEVVSYKYTELISPVCYTTDYGEMYHADGCQYLYNSKNETTVYAAKAAGYGDCGACEPDISVMRLVRLPIEETASATREHYPASFATGGGIAVLAYAALVMPKRKKYVLSLEREDALTAEWEEKTLLMRLNENALLSLAAAPARQIAAPDNES